MACITAVGNAEEAVRLANDSPFALGATVFGGDQAAAIARRLTAGMIGINRGIGGVSGTPWVGARQSGYGFHHSLDGHRQLSKLESSAKFVPSPTPNDSLKLDVTLQSGIAGSTYSRMSRKSASPPLQDPWIRKRLILYGQETTLHSREWRHCRPEAGASRRASSCIR